jgi:hypothetical protein
MPTKTKTLDQAVAKAKRLPAADQRRIAEELDRYVEDLASLREKLEEGVRSLDAGLGGELDIEELIARANAGHAER